MLAKDLRVRLFADTSDIEEMSLWSKHVSGFTTNPTLMKKAGISNYENFVRRTVDLFPEHDLSFEVLADDLSEMHREATALSKLGPNIFVKIPIVNTIGDCCLALIRSLLKENVKVNITAVMTLIQISKIIEMLDHTTTKFIVSVFCGRIADTGIDPYATMQSSRRLLNLSAPNSALLWASCREVLNVVQANRLDIDIVTCGPEILSKLHLLGKDLRTYSLETVRQFRSDAISSGLVVS